MLCGVLGKGTNSILSSGDFPSNWSVKAVSVDQNNRMSGICGKERERREDEEAEVEEDEEEKDEEEKDEEEKD